MRGQQAAEDSANVLEGEGMYLLSSHWRGRGRRVKATSHSKGKKQVHETERLLRCQDTHGTGCLLPSAEGCDPTATGCSQDEEMALGARPTSLQGNKRWRKDGV